MNAALDVHYTDNLASAACITFESWTDAEAVDTYRIAIPEPRPYRPGRFYERELPPLLAVLEKTGETFNHILIDGYVYLKNNRPGLGEHLHQSVSYPTAVIGIAKNPLAIVGNFAPVLRGRSSKPLFVSAIGWDLKNAAAVIADMHGPFRIPTLLRLADRIARDV